jgi:hypothetical protein
MTNNTTYEDAEKITLCQGDIDYQGIVKHINDGVVIIREGNIVFANKLRSLAWIFPISSPPPTGRR